MILYLYNKEFLKLMGSSVNPGTSYEFLITIQIREMPLIILR
jgi:hypothetical protein